MRLGYLTLATFWVLAAVLGAVPLSAPPSPTAAVAWETAFDAAQARAQREGKPILLLHMFGRLDDEFC